MSKRFFPQQHGDRKKPRLDVTISDHNFPLSQNKESDQNNWGDDNDDEILLLASQACEEAYNETSLPDYSMFMQPGSTSTQICDPGPSTSKTSFTFKKPSLAPPNAISTSLKDKCNRISSPLPGMSSKVVPKVDEHINLTDDLIFNDKICKGQDSDYVYRQLLQLQEENAKLKSENGKLLEKCVTKEGEASILRTQLKTCQVSVDNARLERIKAQEKVQMEWTEKLTVSNDQMRDLRTQLDFKNLEIISIKERCRMLESNKIKLTQVTIPNNDISSHRNNISALNDSSSRRVKTASSSAQTDQAPFVKLNKTYRTEPSRLTTILPLILTPTTDQHSLLQYNEKLQNHTDLSQNKCRVYSTFHRIPSTPAMKETREDKVALSCIYEDLTCIAADDGNVEERFCKVLKVTKMVLLEVQSQLEAIRQKMTTAFQREMDEKYLEATSTFTVVDMEDLLSGRSLYKEEQAVLARRMAAILAYILQYCTNISQNQSYEENFGDTEKSAKLVDILSRICSLLDSTSCALLYSGFLLSVTLILSNFLNITLSANRFIFSCMGEADSKMTEKIVNITKSIITSRPMSIVCCEVLKLLRRLALTEDFMSKFCTGGNGGNLKLDYDQGMLLYKKDSCYIQILSKQIEVALKCIEKENLIEQARETTQNLIGLYSNINYGTSGLNEEITRCECQLVLIQVIVYALRICAVMLKNSSGEVSQVLGVCRSGVQLVHVAQAEAQLAHGDGHLEGQLQRLAEAARGLDSSPLYGTMLSELCSTFQAAPEDMTSSFHRQAWLKSFETFSITD